MPLAPPVESAPAYVFAAEGAFSTANIFSSPERMALSAGFLDIARHWSSSSMNQLSLSEDAVLEYRPITPNSVHDIRVRYEHAGRAPISSPDIED